jgi:hypothetical protein
VAVVMLAVVMVLAVMLTLIVGWRVVGTVLGNRGSGAADGKCEGDGERCGYARYELHLCLLIGRVPVVT